MITLTIFLTFLALTMDFTPQIVEIQEEIAELQARNRQLKYKRCKNYDKFYGDSEQVIPKLDISLSFTQVCQFNSSNFQSFFMQSLTNIYIVVNFPDLNQVKIYNLKCQELSVLMNLQVMNIMTDRGQIQSNLAYIIGKDFYIYALQEETMFKNITKITNITSQTTLVGGLVRYRGREKAQIFIIYKDGTVKVIDESGNKKLSFSLGNSKIEIQKVIDRHPYPLVSTNTEWLLVIDTSKYSQIEQDCPHFSNIKAILTQSHYNNIVYLITAQKVYLVSLQHHKRQCSIKQEYSLQNILGKINKVSYFGHLLFIDDKVYNLTEKKLYRQEECQNESYYQFIMRKNHPDQNYCLKKCCESGTCTLSFGKINKKPQDRRIFLWLCICFALVIFVSLSYTFLNEVLQKRAMFQIWRSMKYFNKSSTTWIDITIRFQNKRSRRQIK